MLFRSAEDRFPEGHAVLAVARLLRLLRGEDADVAGAHLAAGRPRRGADGGLRTSNLKWERKKKLKTMPIEILHSQES